MSKRQQRSERKKLNVDGLVGKIKFLIIPLIVALVVELVLVKGVHYGRTFWFPRIATLFGLVLIIELVLLFGLNKIISYLIKFRYKLAGIMILVSSFIGFFESTLPFKYWIISNGFLSLLWNIKFYVLVLVTFELFKLITDNERASFYSMIVVVFSAAVQYNFNDLSLVLIVGQLSVLFVNLYLTVKQNNILFGILFIVSAILYTFTYTAFAVPFAYAFIGLIIWLIIKNYSLLKEKKLIKIGLLFLMITFFGMIITKVFIAPFNSEIPVYLELTSGANGIFSYIYSILLPFKDITNSIYLAGIFSIAPIPMIVALILCYKYEDDHVNDKFLMPLSIISVLLTIYVLIENLVPGFIKNVTMLALSGTPRILVALQYINLLLLVYILEHMDKKLMSFKATTYFIIIIAIIMSLITGIPEEINSRWYLIIYTIQLVITGILFTNYDDKKYKRVCYGALVLFTIIGGIFINNIVMPNINKSVYKVTTIESTENVDNLENEESNFVLEKAK